MSWLDDIPTELKFDCEDGHREVVLVKASEVSYQARVCPECQKPSSYAGMVPREISMMGKVAYDQNGRLAYKISDGKGASSYMSKTKYDYLQTGIVKSAYTKDYERHVVNSGDAHSLEAVDLTKMKRRPSGGIRELMQDAAKKQPKRG